MIWLCGCQRDGWSDEVLGSRNEVRHVVDRRTFPSVSCNAG